MKRRLEGKNVLMTGASSGIGQAIAIRFAQEGANVAIHYRSGAEQAEATQARSVPTQRERRCGERSSCRPTSPMRIR